MPDGEAPGSSPRSEPGASRLDAVERLRRQVEQIESHAPSTGSPDDESWTKPIRRRRGSAGRRRFDSDAGAGGTPHGVWRTDGGPVAEGDAGGSDESTAEAPDHGGISPRGTAAAGAWKDPDGDLSDMPRGGHTECAGEGVRLVGDPGGLGGDSRLDTIERLRRQLAQIESRPRSTSGPDDDRGAKPARRQRGSAGRRAAGSADDAPTSRWFADESLSGEDDSGVSSHERVQGEGRRRGSRRRSGSEASGPAAQPSVDERPDAVPTGSSGARTETQAKDVCLRLLTDRARSRAELSDKLAAKGFAPEVAERTLNRLAEIGLVDDAAFAEQWVHSRHTFSGKGKKVLAQELRRKGVSDAHAEPALAAITPADESARAADLVRRKLSALPTALPRQKLTARLVGMLARRGFQQSMAYAVVKEELAATADRVLDDSGAAATTDERATGIGRAHPEHEPGETSTTAAPAAQRTRELDAEQAVELVRRKLRTIPGSLPRDKAVNRLVGMLVRRGCPQSIAYAVVRDELSHRPPSEQETVGTAGVLPTAGVIAGVPPRSSDIDWPARPDRPEPDAESDSIDLAAELVRRKLRTMPHSLSQDKVTNRLLGMLARRGYSSSVAYAVVKAELVRVSVDTGPGRRE